MDLHYHFLIYLSLCIISKLSAWVVMDIYDKQGPENEEDEGRWQKEGCIMATIILLRVYKYRKRIDDVLTGSFNR